MVSRINGGARTAAPRCGCTRREPPRRQAGARARPDAQERVQPGPRTTSSRARRQQKILSAIKSRLISPKTFFRLPLVCWQAPKAIRSDMAGPALLGLFGSVATGGTPDTRVLPGVPERQRPERPRRRQAARGATLPEGMIELAQRLNAAMNARDIDAFVALFAPDYDSRQPAHPDRAFTGNEQVRANWTEIFAGVPDFRSELIGAVADGDTLWTRVALAGHRPRHRRRDRVRRARRAVRLGAALRRAGRAGRRHRGRRPGNERARGAVSRRGRRRARRGASGRRRRRARWPARA